MVNRFFDLATLYHKGRSAAFEVEEFLLIQIGYPLITMIFYCLIASYSYSTTNLARWVIGNSFLLCTNACIFGLGNIFIGERFFGRLRSIIASPCSKLLLILASGVFPTIFAVCASIMGLIVGALVFCVDFSGVNLFFVLIIIICSMASATCFGLFLSILGLMNDSMHMILNIVSYLLMIFTGAEFPVSQLPLWGRVISQFMPLTKAIAAMNMMFEGNMKGMYLMLLAEIAIGFFYAILSLGLFKYVEHYTQRMGRFDLF